jgi:hypothetical protein
MNFLTMAKKEITKLSQIRKGDTFERICVHIRHIRMVFLEYDFFGVVLDVRDG